MRARCPVPPALLCCILFCAPSVVFVGFPSTFSYASIGSKRIAFCRPVVTSSEIFYENRYTNQSYHSIDKSRTADAFFRDFTAHIAKSRLNWIECDSAADSLIRSRFAYSNNTVDSLPADVRQKLVSAGIDILVLVYAMRLYHLQSVGLRPDKTGSVTSYGTIISRKLDYSCSLIDVAANRPVFYIPMKKVQNGTSLNIMENTVKDLFDVLMQRRK